MKILNINGLRTEEVYDGSLVGTSYLYPEGTQRIVSKYFLFPRKLNGETRSGSQVVEQVATIKLICDADGSVHYNKWRNVRFVEYPLLEKNKAIVRKDLTTRGYEPLIIQETLKQMRLENLL